MKNLNVMLGLLFVAALTLVSTPAFASDMVINKGHEPGKLTQDYDAAMSYAKEKKLPVMLVFTGSDWCGWCKLMDKNVFSKPEWSSYAKDNLVQVWLDFPRDKSLVPADFVERNNTLKGEYGVRGYPTYIIVDHDGDRLGQLGAGQEKTPASFQAEMEKVLVKTHSGIKDYCSKLKPADSEKVMKSFDAVKALVGKGEKGEPLVAAKKALDDAMEQGKVNAMTPAKQKEYAAAKQNLEKAEAAITAFREKHARSKPTKKLNNEYQQLISAYKDAAGKLETF